MSHISQINEGRNTGGEQFYPELYRHTPIVQPIIRVIDRIRYYSNGAHDFAVFTHGTFVLLEDDLSEREAELFAQKKLQDAFHTCSNTSSMNMDDGNILIRYGDFTAGIILSDIAQENWFEIEQFYDKALLPNEVPIAPHGRNIFDDVGKKILYARSMMFMDAKDPRVMYIVRKTHKFPFTFNPFHQP